MSGPSPRAMAAIIRAQACVKLKEPTASFAGETVIVTGSNRGLGRVAALQLARLGASRVILTARNLASGEEARAHVEKTSGRPGIAEVWQLDMASAASVAAFARRAADLPRLDVVILNAGGWPKEFKTGEGGAEATIKVNVISTFQLYLALLPTLRRSARAHSTVARATVLGSGLHTMAALKARKQPSIFEGLAQPFKPAEGDGRYHDSKLLVMLYARALAAATPLSADTGPVVLDVVNPGWCESELHDVPAPQRLLAPILQRSAEAGGWAMTDAVRPMDLQTARRYHGAYVDEQQVNAPARWIETDDGRDTQRRVFRELNGILEDIEHGITNAITEK